MKSINYNNDFMCKLCNREFKDNQSLGVHISKYHIKNNDIDSLSDYFDRFIIKNINEKECRKCGKQTVFLSLGKGYNKYCSDKCASSHLDKNKNGSINLKNTLKKIYSDQNIKNRIVNKRKNTVMGKYGVSHIMQIPSVKESIKLTNLERYNEDNPAKSDKVKEKTKQNNLKKYGVEYPSQLYDIKKKIKESMNKKYGVDHHLQLDSQKQKQKDTVLERYGGFSFESDEIKNKIKKTMNEKYGVDTPMENENIKNKMKITHRNNYWDTFLLRLKQRQLIPLFDFDYYISADKLNFKCGRCGNEFITDIFNPQKIVCECAKNKSGYEYEIIEWIRSKIKNVNIKHGDRSFGKELDIYIPEYNIGIEFHGLYWHSDLYKSKNYHQEKFLFFKDKHVGLIQIFENEWVNKQDIVKSIILSKLNIYNNRIYGRECEIKEISNKDYIMFLEENHIQGAINSTIKLGLYYDDEIVSVLGVGKSRFKKNEIEIHRFCNKLNTQIVGGFSKLLSYYKNNYEFNSIISYIDLRYFDGSGYIKNGFKIESISKPNYFYFKNNRKEQNNLYNRITFQKHKLKDKLEFFNPDKTEYENMLDNNYLRIFDAGNYKLILRSQNG